MTYSKEAKVFVCMLFRLDQQGSLFGGRRKLLKKTTYVSSENTDLFI